MQDTEIKNRRINERVPVKLSLRLSELSLNINSIAQVRDISTEGIGVLTAKELQTFSHLEMWLPIFHKDEPLYAKGEVVWSKMIEPDKYMAEVELKEVDPSGIMQVIWENIMIE